MAESDLSSEVSGVTILPAATGLSGSESSGDIDLSWTNNDDSPDGGIDVERSTDGFSTVNTLASGLATTTTSYTDTTVSEGVAYEYRIERNTDDETATSEKTSVATSIAEARIDKTGTTLRVPIYDPSTITDNWLRVRVNGSVGVLRPVSESGETLRARSPSDTIVGVETRQL